MSQIGITHFKKQAIKTTGKMENPCLLLGVLWFHHFAPSSFPPQSQSFPNVHCNLQSPKGCPIPNSCKSNPLQFNYVIIMFYKFWVAEPSSKFSCNYNGTWTDIIKRNLNIHLENVIFQHSLIDSPTHPPGYFTTTNPTVGQWTV